MQGEHRLYFGLCGQHALIDHTVAAATETDNKPNYVIYWQYNMSEQTYK